jgi:iron complex transport system substrate-binding protein
MVTLRRKKSMRLSEGRQPQAGAFYFVDLPKLKAIHPDVVGTQDLCHVCAISESDLAKAISELPSRPHVISLAPHTLEQVLQSIETIGGAIGRQSEARDLIDGLRRRIERVTSNGATAIGSPPRGR